jgi:predicted RNase H-like HicB family nuclease
MIRYTAAFYHHPEDGWYTAAVLDFPGVLTQGRTLEKARRMLCDALRMMSEGNIRDGIALPKPVPGITDSEATLTEPIELVIRGRTTAASP